MIFLHSITTFEVLAVITSLYASLQALMYIILSLIAIKDREKFKITLGHSEEIELLKKIRAHGNFIEYTPLFLILLLICELNGLHPLVLYVLGAIFVNARLLHCYALIKEEVYENGKLVSSIRSRVRAMLLTFGCIAVLALILLGQFIFSSSALP